MCSFRACKICIDRYDKVYQVLPFVTFLRVLSDLFSGLSDLHLGNQKVTNGRSWCSLVPLILNQLGIWCFLNHLDLNMRHFVAPCRWYFGWSFGYGTSWDSLGWWQPLAQDELCCKLSVMPPFWWAGTLATDLLSLVMFVFFFFWWKSQKWGEGTGNHCRECTKINR